MKFWGAEVKPGKSLKLNLSDDQTLRVTQVGCRCPGGGPEIDWLFGALVSRLRAAAAEFRHAWLANGIGPRQYCMLHAPGCIILVISHAAGGYLKPMCARRLRISPPQTPSLKSLPRRVVDAARRRGGRLILRGSAMMKVEMRRRESSLICGARPQASLGDSVTEGQRSVITVLSGGQKYIIASLLAGKSEHAVMELMFESGPLEFSVTGKNAVHLAGNMIDDEGDDDEDEEDEDMMSMSMGGGKKQIKMEDEVRSAPIIHHPPLRPSTHPSTHPSARPSPRLVYPPPIFPSTDPCTLLPPSSHSLLHFSCSIIHPVTHSLTLLHSHFLTRSLAHSFDFPRQRLAPTPQEDHQNHAHLICPV
jgi:hypothetical protein